MTPGAGAVDRGVLDNAVPFLVHHRPGAAVTTVSVWLLAGSRHEARPGVAHLFEHVVMQAVPAGRTLRAVDEIEAYGGEANAVTSRDQIALYARVPTTDAPAALAVLADAACGHDFDEDVVEAERRVVLEELRLAAADPTDIVHDFFFEAAYGQHPLGRPVGGTAAGVAELTRADLTSWARACTVPQRLGVVVSGGLSLAEVEQALASGALARLNAGDLGGAEDAAAFDPAAGDPPPALRAVRRDLSISSDTAVVVVGGHGFSYTDPQVLAAEVAAELLAGGNASVLVEEIRSRRGLSYDISAGVSAFRDTGIWRCAISTAPEQRDHVVDLTTKLLAEAAQRGWSEAEVELARRRVGGLLRLEAESSLDDAMLLGRYALVGGWADWTLPSHLERLAAVNADEVNRCAQLMLEPMCIATAGGEVDLAPVEAAEATGTAEGRKP